jgi:ribosomal protein L35AE/L33A
MGERMKSRECQTCKCKLKFAKGIDYYCTNNKCSQGMSTGFLHFKSISNKEEVELKVGDEVNWTDRNGVTYKGNVVDMHAEVTINYGKGKKDKCGNKWVEE